MLSSFIQALMSAEADAVCVPRTGHAVPSGPTHATVTGAGTSTPVVDLTSAKDGAILAFTAYSNGAVAADLVQQPTGTSSTSASFETTADTNVILRRYATSYMIPEKRPFLAPW
jgi:hypothetical protein